MSHREIPTTGTEPCQIDPELFFVFEGQTREVAEAKAMCAGCRTRSACLEFAIDTDQQFGIWGGTTESERRGLRLARALAEAGVEQEVA